MGRKSLERQDTLYDEVYNGTDSYSDYNNSSSYNPEMDSFDQYDTSTDYVSEDRQWDSGGGRHTSLGKRLPEVPLRGSTSVSEGLYYTNSRGASLPATPVAQKRQSAQHRALPQPTTSVATAIAAATLTKSPKMLPPIPSGAGSGRSKRKMPTPVIKTDIYSDADVSKLIYLFPYKFFLIILFNFHSTSSCYMKNIYF